MTAKKPVKPEPRPVVQVAWHGTLVGFKLYTDADGAPFVRTPDGKKAPVALRRDGTYMVTR